MEATNAKKNKKTNPLSDEEKQTQSSARQKTMKPLADRRTRVLVRSASSENSESCSSFLPFAVVKEREKPKSESKALTHKYLNSIPCLAKINSNDSSRLRVKLSKKTVETNPPQRLFLTIFFCGLNTSSAGQQLSSPAVLPSWLVELDTSSTAISI